MKTKNNFLKIPLSSWLRVIFISWLSFNGLRGNAQINISPKVFLAAAYGNSTGLMNDSLRAATHLGDPGGAIPVPYLIPPHIPSTPTHFLPFTGTPIAPAVYAVSGPNAIVDWVYVELRNASNNITVVASKHALVQRDGDVVSTDGVSSLNFPTVSPGNYYVSIKHRNHLGVMTASTLALAASTQTVDFTSGSVWNKPDVSNAPRVLVNPGVYALWAGDALNNGNTKYIGSANDKEAILNAVLGAVPPGYPFPPSCNTLYGYRNEDINMDGKVRYSGKENDRSFMLNLINNSVTLNGCNPNLILYEHIPSPSTTVSNYTLGTCTSCSGFSLTLLEDQAISCCNTNDASVQATVLPSSSYTYTIVSPPGASAIHPSNTSGFFNNLAAGTHTVYASNGTCTTCQTITLSNSNSPLDIEFIVDSMVSCHGNDGTLSINITGGINSSIDYQTLWTNSNGDILNDVLCYTSTLSLSNLSAGNYHVTIEDDNGCFYSETGTLNAAPPIVLTANYNPIICNGGCTAITPSGSGGVSYPPAYTSTLTYTINGLPIAACYSAGTYNVVATDEKGCTSSTSLILNQGAACTPTYLKFFIEGYWNGTSEMKPVRMNGSCPTPNGSTVTAQVTVELRAAIAPYNFIELSAATVMTDGTCTATFAGTYTGSYFIVVKGCNFLETWSAAPVNLASLTSTTPYDFSTALAKAYDDNLGDGIPCMKQISSSPIREAFLSGDINQDGNIGLSDLILIQNDINNNLSGCICSDLNGDGVLNQQDVINIQTNFFQWMKRPY